MWGARQVEIKSAEERTRAALTVDEVKFNQHLDEKLFAPENRGLRQPLKTELL